ncbi:response regulator [Bradyrhizobium guangzhouense]|uniref:histidine kinase n=2 Tax=Bradyrhizobium guangzhouense TaxID=1325095 RepID=A0AAE5X145_9BRAD|nr:hybrid sensor histidine kinase/response regulator [Bradyrhizobium guangzhouense]RXH09058.1 response regulator [Bradyrhizobium guangzhouense]
MRSERAAAGIRMTDNESGSKVEQSDFQFLIEKNADGIIVVDEAGLVLFANPAAERLFGQRSSDLIGSPIGLPIVVDEMSEIAIHQPGGGLVDAEIRTVETIWDGRPARLASVRDVSERRAMEDRTRHAAKMEAIGRLTAGIAHDFNNLLAVVLGNLESATRRIDRERSELGSLLDNATRGAQQAVLLTSKLLAFARRKPLEFRLVDLSDLLASMSDLLQRTFDERIAVRADIPSGLWAVEVDPTELEAAILNLAVNARDAMPDGGELVITTENVDFACDDAEEDGGKAGPHVRISVSDSGEGMTADVLNRVLEPFFTTKGDGRGTGLGLSQVYGFAKQSGGHLRLRSEPNAGTRIDIYLPKATSSDQMSAPAEPRSELTIPRARGGETILAVEDDEDVRAITVGNLRELGYTVVEAADADAALRFLQRQETFDLLFTDLGLPGSINGKMLADRARALHPELKVLITTAYAGDVLIREGRLDPQIELLSKPFSFAALGNRIRGLLDSGRSGPGRVLLVEDEFLLNLLVTDMLAEAGFSVDAAASFGEAATKAHSGIDDLVGAVVDLGLPDRPGDELVTELRALYPDLPVVLATGYADEDVRSRFSVAKGVQLLTKPFDLEGLKAALCRAGVRIVLPMQDVQARPGQVAAPVRQGRAAGSSGTTA